MKSRNIIFTLVLAGSVFGITGPLNAQISLTKKLVGLDGHSSLTVPGSWDTLSLNNVATLQCGNSVEETYAIIINDNKMDLDGWNMQKHSYIVLGNFLNTLASPKVEGPKKLTINGFNAIQYEIQGAINGQNIVYILTDIETPHVFSQVLCWTLRSQIKKHHDLLDKIAKTYTDPDAK